jgi:predicted O-methyltransferase YrrM
MTLVASPGGGYTRPDDPGEPRIGAPRISVSDLEAKILGGFAAHKRVLEIGTGLGVSTRALAANAVSVVTHDIDPWVHDTIWPELEREYGNIDFAETLTTPFLVDLVFIDADHATDAVRADVHTAEKFLWSGGLIVAHDTNDDGVKAGLGGGFQFLTTEHGLGYRVIAGTW